MAARKRTHVCGLHVDATICVETGKGKLVNIHVDECVSVGLRSVDDAIIWVLRIAAARVCKNWEKIYFGEQIIHRK